MIKVPFSLIRPVCILHMSRALCGTPEVWERVGCCLSPVRSHGRSGGQGGTGEQVGAWLLVQLVQPKGGAQRFRFRGP